MKIQLTIVENYEYDEQEELKRLKDCFEGEQLDRQLAIFNHFLNQEWDKMKEAYFNLPYDDKEGCPEQEYVGLWSYIVFGGSSSYNFLKKSYRTVEMSPSIPPKHRLLDEYDLMQEGDLYWAHTHEWLPCVDTKESPFEVWSPSFRPMVRPLSQDTI